MNELNKSLQSQLQAAKESGELEKLTQNALQKALLLTADELDEHGGTGNVVIASNVAWSPDMAVATPTNGWIIRYVGPKEEGRYGRLVLFPDSQWAETLWKKGQLAFISRFGLTDKQKEVWVTTEFRARHDQPALRLLANVLASPTLLHKYLSFNPKWSDEEAMRWDARENVRHRLYHGSRIALAMLTKIMYDNKTIDDAVIAELNKLRGELRATTRTPKPPKPKRRTLGQSLTIEDDGPAPDAFIPNTLDVEFGK